MGSVSSKKSNVKYLLSVLTTLKADIYKKWQLIMINIILVI